jgi:hypothetical protein
MRRRTDWVLTVRTAEGTTYQYKKIDEGDEAEGGV